MKNILIFFIKVIGLVWVFPCIPFRTYARSVVYNYVLQNNKEFWLGRLWQRQPTQLGNEWILHDVVHDVGRNGSVKYRKVNKVQFYLVVIFIWGWLDDDSNHDTTDLGYIMTWFTGERKDRAFAKIVGWLVGNVDPAQVYGNTFDLGDFRDVHPFFNFGCTLLWNTRNTGMNFKYLWMNY